MRRATAAPKNSPANGKRSRSCGCATFWWRTAHGRRPRSRCSPAKSPRACARRCRPTSIRRLPSRRRCSGISMRACRASTGGSSPRSPKTRSAMSSITLVEAINLALARAMEEDERVVVLGEDVGRNGGVFRATLGLLERFGAARVADTPLAEGLIAGMALGMAAEGLRPVAEIQFAGFAYTAIDQLLNHARRLRHRTQGRLACPMVLRTPCGAGIHAPEHHSESPEAMFAHIPGIRVVYPSSPARAYGLLLAAIQDPDPVVFLEPSRLYRRVKGEVDDDGTPLPLDKAFVVREGTDVTIIAWGAMLHEALQAAEQLATDGHFAEVIDLATLKPIDFDTVLASVKKTGRCVVISEAPRTCSLASEISANISEQALLSLLAPVERVTAFDCVTPMFRLEERYMPDAARIAAAARKVMEYQ